MAMLNEKAEVIESNDRLRFALEVEIAELHQTHFETLLSKDYPDVLRAEIRSNLSKGSAWKGQLKHITKSNRVVWVEASIQPNLDDKNELVGFTFIGFDITEQKAVEEALQNNKLFLRKLIASAPVGIFIADGIGECELINQKWSQMSGLNLRQAAGTGWLQAIHPDDRGKVASAWTQLIELGIEFQFEYRYRNAVGVDIPVLASASILRDPATLESRMIRIEQDLTEQKRNEEIINVQKAQIIATAKLTSLGEMASSIAHEINNPLAAILGSAELLKETLLNAKPDLARVDRMADTVIKNTERIAKIIKSLRMISRDADNDIAEVKDLSTIFNDTLEMCVATARVQQTEIRVVNLSPEMKLHCKPAQITQTLLALVKNSLWAVQHLKERWVEIEIKDLNSRFEIRVTDSGSGIPKASRAKVFQPFFTTAPVGKGTGLGLSVAKGVIENHNGSIRLDEECEHTRFIITLPKGPERQSLGLSSQ